MFKLAVASEIESFHKLGKVQSSLDTADGYIHLSDCSAPPTVAKLFFTTAADLHILEIDESKLSGPVTWVKGKMGDEPPDEGTIKGNPGVTVHYLLPEGCVHVYGDQGVPMKAVMRQAKCPLGKDGVHRFPEWLTSDVMEMKCTMKKPVGFYIKSAQAFLKGVDAVEATDGKEAKEAKPPVEEMKISGLGEAINAAVSAAVRAEAEGLATITEVKTLYPEMTEGRGCAQIVLTLKKK